MGKDSSSVERVAYSPGEFASLFGKSQTWGYRQIYAGKVHAITEHGRILIPAKEVENVLKSAGIYNGIEKPKQQKARIAKLKPEQQGIWRRFLESRKIGQAPASSLSQRPKPGPVKRKRTPRSAATKRIRKAWSKSS